MLEQIRFSFRLKALSYLHVGNGRRISLAKMRGLPAESKNGKAEVACVQRDARGWPVIEGSSIRGALRAFCRQKGFYEADLFGPDKIGQGKADNGCLWLRAGFLSNAEALSARSCDLPYWSAEPEGETDERPSFPYTFVMPGVRLDADTGTVGDDLFYHVEFVPAGAEFLFSGIYFDSEENFVEQLGALFNLMACNEGFALGAVAHNGNGRVQLDQKSVDYEVLRYSVSPGDGLVVSGWQRLTVAPEEGGTGDWSRQFVLTCDGPFFIMDPIRAATEKAEARDDAHVPDMVALREDASTPVLTGKAILQDLRRRSAWLERCDAIKQNGFDYQDSGLPGDDPDRQLRERDDPADLEITQRLFGVAGWAKTVSIRVEPLPSEQCIHRTQGLKLDVFSQAPIDGALIDIEVPAQVRFRVTFGFDERRYAGMKADLERDRDHLDSLMTELVQLHCGHATGVGFGRFAVSTD